MCVCVCVQDDAGDDAGHVVSIHVDQQHVHHGHNDPHHRGHFAGTELRQCQAWYGFNSSLSPTHTIRIVRLGMDITQVCHQHTPSG